MADFQDHMKAIKALDEGIKLRFELAENADPGWDYKVDEHNADDRERIHEHAIALVQLLTGALPVIEEALGDAYAYRTDSGETAVDSLEDYEQEACARYMGLAGQLDVTID